MSPLAISNIEARNLIFDLQGLCAEPHKAFAADGLETLINKLGFVQMDAIPYVERAHQMILFSRNQTFRPNHLKRLHETDRVLFENWTHDASLIPVRFWPFWKHKFSRDENRLQDKFTRWQGSGFLEHADALVQRIRHHGPLRARDLERPKSEKLEMWQWHDGKAALEYLWRTGKLAVVRRERFEKVYDLPERALPPEYVGLDYSREDFMAWACRSAIDRLGIATPGDIARFWDLVTIDEVKGWLDTHGRQETVPVEVEPADGGKARVMVARPDIEPILTRLTKMPPRMRTLSPFDPVIRDRKRLSWLFGFDYTIEIYVPPEKRKFGYYIFPLLDGDNLIGRADIKAEREHDRLLLNTLWLEKSVRWSKAKQNRLEAELTRLCRLTGVSRYVFDPQFLQD